jgi:CD109 antigen
MAITAYALELAASDKADDAYEKLMDMAQEDEDGLHWGDGPGKASPEEPWLTPASAEIETTAYATLALTKHGDALNASRAAQWLVSRRNAYGGFGSTQDTVVALQALTEYATDSRADVDLKVKVTGDGFNTERRVTAENFDVLQVVELPIDGNFKVSVTGKGEVIGQIVRRFNVPEAEPGDEVIKINVDYDTAEVAVNDLVTVSASLVFNPPEPVESGMIVLDISVPTGFGAVSETIERALSDEAKIKRYEIAGRKVIFYIDDMKAGESLDISFQVRALYPVKAKGVSSQAYSYYKPEIRGESLSESITVN